MEDDSDVTNFKEERFIRNVELISLGNLDDEFNAVKVMLSSDKQFSSRFKVLSITKIINRDLREEFSLYERKIEREIGTKEKCMLSLFHGTSSDVVDKVIKEGFDWRVCGKNGTAFGRGSYFSRDPSYSCKYSTPDTSGLRRMFITSVITGRKALGSPQMVREPDGHHSTVNDLANPLIYVIYHIKQAYPEYLVTFKEDVPQRKILAFNNPVFMGKEYSFEELRLQKMQMKNSATATCFFVGNKGKSFQELQWEHIHRFQSIHQPNPFLAPSCSRQKPPFGSKPFHFGPKQHDQANMARNMPFKFNPKSSIVDSSNFSFNLPKGNVFSFGKCNQPSKTPLPQPLTSDQAYAKPKFQFSTLNAFPLSLNDVKTNSLSFNAFPKDNNGNKDRAGNSKNALIQFNQNAIPTFHSCLAFSIGSSPSLNAASKRQRESIKSRRKVRSRFWKKVKKRGWKPSLAQERSGINADEWDAL